jgi:hypothetical protein
MHGDTICPKYDEVVLPDEMGNCSLCGSVFTSKRIVCLECLGAGKKRFSFPIKLWFKHEH